MKNDLKPRFSDGIAIAITSSDLYAPFLGVLLKSILLHSSSENNYDIVVLEKEISSEYKRMLEQEVSGYKNFSLRYIEISPYIEKYSFHTDYHITVMTYCRLLLLDIMKNFQKVVYLDSDVVLMRDIADLYKKELGNNLIAAAPDTVMAGIDNIEKEPKDFIEMRERKRQLEWNLNELGVKDVFRYFNAGIVLMNLDEFRKKYTSDELMRYEASKDWKWFDQDVLNKICYGRSILLPINWNVMCHNEEAEGDLAEQAAPDTIYKEYLAAKKEPYALHYCGKTIPCFTAKVNNADAFWNIARDTPFYEIILQYMMDTRYQLLRGECKSFIRRLADIFFPKGSKRRALLKFIMPRNSLQWNVSKNIYHIISPEFW